VLYKELCTPTEKDRRGTEWWKYELGGGWGLGDKINTGFVPCRSREGDWNLILRRKAKKLQETGF
jgi:hypothetical protein